MVKQLRVMAIGAHPDDPEIYCGGTLAKYSSRGDIVFMVYVTDGSAGALSGDRKKLAKTRLEEGKNAAKIIKAEVISLGLPDSELEYCLKNRLKIIEAIRYVNPDIIITHPPYDQNSDHRITSQLVNDANLHSLGRKIKTKSKPINDITPIFYMEPANGLGFIPTEYVDITDYFKTKVNMFLEHKSQVKYLKASTPGSNNNILDWIEITARFRGYQCKVKYAEGFTPLIVSGCMRTERLLP